MARVAHAAPLAAWDVSTLPGGTNNFGASPLAATTSDPRLTVGGLTRGAGVGTSGAGASRAWGGNAFTATSEAAAITSNQFASFTLTAASGYRLSIASLGVLDYRRSSTGPASGVLQYQVGSGAFADGPALTYTSSSSSGASLGPIDLSSIAALQNVPGGTVVSFRIVNWGGASTGTWYIFDKAGSSAPDFEVDGTVQQAATAVSVESAANGSGSVVAAQTVANGQSVTVYAVARDAGNAFVANTAANWSLTSITGAVVAGDLVPAADAKSATFTAHAAGTAVIRATASGLASVDSGVITAGAPQFDPTASGLATPATVAANQTILLEVAVVPGSNPASTGLNVTGNLATLSAGSSTSFHDDGQNGDRSAGDNIFSYQLSVNDATPGGSKTLPISVQDAQGRSASTSISLRMLGSLTIFHMNDTHARITPHKWIVPTHAAMSTGFESVGGAAYLASAVLEGTAATPDALVLDGGDISEGNPVGDIGGNLSMVQFYDMLTLKLVAQRGRGIDALVVGNHDVRDAAYITNLEDLRNEGVPVISVNVRDISTHQPHFAAYTILTVNGVKVGIVGYTTQAAAVGASLASTLEVAAVDWNSTDASRIHMASYVNELRNTQGCDLVILLTHTGHSSLATQTTGDSGTLAPILADDGAAKLPEIAVTGHWHTWAETVWQPDSLHYKTIFTEAGSYMHYLGVLHVDGRGGYESAQSHVLRNSAYTPDSDVQAFLDNLVRSYDSTHAIAFNQVLGYTADDLLLDERMKWWSSDEYPWSGNDTAGQWISDAVQWKCAQLFGQCDLGFEVGGGVRSDIPAGPVTYAQTYETFPWSDDTVERVNMTGQEVVSFIKTTNCDAAFSRALHVVANDGVPSAVTFGGAPIDLAHTYTVGITNYIYEHPPAGWSWSDRAPLTSSVLARDGIVEFMQQFPQSNPYTVGGAHYELNTQFAGIYRAVVTMMNDNDTQPAFEDGFLRLLSATPETLIRRGLPSVPTNLVNEDGSINPANRLAETELYRSYLGFKTGALLPGDIVQVSGKGGFFGGNPEFVDQEGVYANGLEFKIVGHDASLSKPTFMPSISSVLDDAHKNHYVEFLARKASATTVSDQFNTTLKLWDATAFANKTIPGAVGDLLVVTGIATSESYSLRFRANTVDLAASKGISDFPAPSGVSAQLAAVAPESTGGSITLTANAGPTTPTRTLAPSADAEVASGSPATNFGTGTSIFIQSAASGFGNERGWLSFDLSSLPSDSVITAASLEMFCWKTTGASLPVELHGGTSDAWTESTINWNNQPSFGPTLATAMLAASDTNVWYSFDVTSFAQTKWAGNKLVTLVLKPASEDSSATPAPSYGFDAKEFGSNVPVLRVTTQTSGTTLTQTEFYYRYSADGVNFGAWTSLGSDTTSPYSVAFNYPQGNGDYEFYAVATDNLGATQGAPPFAQAFVHREAGPDYTTDAYVTLSDLSQTYNGSPRAVGVTTVPPNLATSVTYDGGASVPVHAGSYAVSATVVQPSYTGRASGSLIVNKATQSISFAALGSRALSAGAFTLSASASSGLPVSFTSTNPAVATVSGNIVTPVSAGTTDIVASQPGNADVLVASAVAQSLIVTAPTQVPASNTASLVLLALCFCAITLFSRVGPRRRA